MRYRGVLQRFYKAKKRLVWSVRHIGYWKRRNNRHPAYEQVKYVRKDQKNLQLGILARADKS